ncbi:MAG: DUF2855 family protein [Betaproteobacteria bacterium]|nr:DUF2855 family protein [Betaproteobacteria bacterium]
MDVRRFEVSKANLRKTGVVDAPLPELADGQVLFAIDSFAFTSNNVTYAAFGDAMQYWQFFPVDDPAQGQIPVWGFADVAESRCPGIAPGERFYGYFPMATHLVVSPIRVAPSGFFDGAAHRQGLHAVYNQYTRCSTDPAYEHRFEAEQMLLKPLFITSFLLDDFVADNDFFGARSVLLSSASSKTAYGTAFMLAQRPGIEVIGLTSEANLAFVEGLGCYSRVVSYAALESIAQAVPRVYVDMSGNADVRGRVHRHFGDALKYSCAVGGTHWEAMQARMELPGPKPTLFFAPAQIKKRVADWGGAEFQQKTAAAWRAFIARVTDPAQPWLTVERGRGPEAISRTVHAMLDGKVAPQDGHILSF